MIQIRKANERGYFNHGWLDTFHTFSFAGYRDPNHMGFRSLRVINEDRVAPGQGFGTHGHQDMEIVTYVLEGALEHRDSLGNGSILRPGEFQRMSAGTGIEHSEFNPSESELVHLYQIWLRPIRRGITPSYEQRAFPDTNQAGKLRLVASNDARDGSLMIHQDASIYLAAMAAEQDISHELRPGRHAWLQILRGSINVAGHSLSAGDGAAVSDEAVLAVHATSAAEIMLFDMG